MTSRERADESGPRYLLIRQLRTLMTELDIRGARFARSVDLHPTDLRALIALLDAERDAVPATPAWLGKKLGGVNSATITSLLDRLERAGLVERTGDPGDRRKVLLSVTERARDTGREFFGTLIDDALTALSEFDSHELDVIGRFLEAMRSASDRNTDDEQGTT
ncbi:MarR family transcriptional regulator [Gordonia sp. 852002-50816_SCH5313054-c]|uniref:MarR family winged helix-turn-helix transcriptional regulator n=1 Tax=unclassified Gordonia (in: high G+C Gram-positive bacteria) TaxID=2657482 RepID=UPI0007E944B5|nr:MULTISPECIES: MarR family transcriptional regulator [unclassified Gordonia (in: high G+C Gram-positive bacteria)]OBC15157.1 MarR family transcriptional regulator [Gordonia sp. 852002-50816_SCH5313054-c]OBC15298.1 MarR family transcriptional regulator [Gordonia sp. 852002-50816_SCH5313054-a]